MLDKFIGIIVSGDFPGYSVMGLEEDNPLVILALALHTLFLG